MSFRILSLVIIMALSLSYWKSQADQIHELLGPFTLHAGQHMRSGSLSLVMQTDGNFVLYKDGVGAVWHMGTYGHDCSSGCSASFQGDGNIVVYKNGVALSSTQTFGQGLQLKISQGPPYISMVSGDSTIWSGSHIFASLVIRSGDIARLPSGVNVAMQVDGNLVITAGGQVVGHTGTHGRNCEARNCVAVFQDDGNLVLYDRGVPYWYTSTQGHGLLLRILPSSPSVSIFSAGVMIWPRPIQSTPSPSSTPAPAPNHEPLNCWGKPIRLYGPC